MALKVQLCGEFRIWRDDEEITALFSRSGGAKTLLKIFLAYPGRIFTRDELIEWLWPEKPFNAGFANLRKRISELRHLLEPQLAPKTRSQYIFTRSGSYGLHPQAPVTSDAQEFSKHWKTGQKLERAGQLQKALSEYEAATCPRPRRISVRRLLRGMGKRSSRTLADASLSGARSLSPALHPTETLWRSTGTLPPDTHPRQMLCHYLAGDSGEALQTYQECAQVLKAHFDTAPVAETEELHQKILRRDRIEAPSYTPPANLPQPLTSFIGREREIAQAQQLLLHTRLLTFTGIGGGGKTRLALKVAEDLVGAYAHGVWFIDLTALSDAALVPQQIIAALGLKEMTGRPAREALIEQLRHRDLFLVLDNCEQLLPQIAHIIKILLTACPNLQILATSRTALGVPGEALLSVPPLVPPPAGPLPLKILQQTEAVSLFIERALALKPSFQLTTENAPFVAQICRQLDGVPLAIELAAARVRVLSLEQIAARLNDLFALLGEASPTAPPHQKTLEATMDWSFQLLTEREKTLLQRLSIFVGGFSLEAAEAVAPDPHPRPLPARERKKQRARIRGGQVLELLSHLVDKSLIIAEEQGAQMRYRMLETVRQYARDRLLEADEPQSICSRHLDFYVNLMAQAWDAIGGPDEVAWLERLEREHDNLRAALAWALETEKIESALRLAKTLWVFWNVRGYRSEGRTWLKRVLAKAQGLRTELYARVLTGAGRLACAQGDYPEARSLFQNTLEIFQELNDKRGIASSWVNSGLVASMQGDHSTARAFYERALALHREIGNLYGVATALGNLGGVAWEQGEYATAQAYYEEELAIERQLQEPERIASALGALGGLAQIEGNYDRATTLFEESLALQRTLGYRDGIAYALSNLGSVAYNRGDFEQARARYEESLQIRRELGDKQGVAYALIGLGSVAVCREETEQARSLFEESLSLFQQMDVRGGKAQALSGLASVAHHQKEYDRAEALYKESLRLHQEGGEKPDIIYCLEGLATVRCAQGQIQRAVTLLAATQALHELLRVRRASLESTERDLAGLRNDLGKEAFDRLWADGRAMTLEQAIEEALAP